MSTRTGRCSFPRVIAGQGLGAGKKGSIHIAGHVRRDQLAGRRARSRDATSSTCRRITRRSSCGWCRRRPDPTWTGCVERWERLAGRRGCRCSSRRTAGWWRSISIGARSNGPSPTATARAITRRIKHLNLPPLGNPVASARLVTKSLVFMGEGFNTHNGGGPPSAAARSSARSTRPPATSSGKWNSPGGTTRRPMTYMDRASRYIVVAPGWTGMPGELVALALP